MVAATDQLRLLFDGSRLGFSVDCDMLLPVTAVTYRPSQGPGSNALSQSRCADGFTRCMRRFGDLQWAMIEWVILSNRSVCSFEQAHAMPHQRTMETLLAVLDTVGLPFRQ
jgi:hypothetical protein